MDNKIEITKELIDQMKSAGEDTSIPRPVDFLFIGEKAELEKLELALKKEGFKSIPSDYSDPEKSILVSKTMDVDSLLTTNIISELDNIAVKYSVIFDGWETVPFKNNI